MLRNNELLHTKNVLQVMTALLHLLLKIKPNVHIIVFDQEKNILIMIFILGSRNQLVIAGIR